MRALTFKKNVRVSSSRRDTLRSLCDSLGFGLAFETLNASHALWKRLPSMKSGTSKRDTSARRAYSSSRARSNVFDILEWYRAWYHKRQRRLRTDYERCEKNAAIIRHPGARTNTVAITSTVCAQALRALFHPFIQSIN